LADSGVRELIVVAQDTTYYGIDMFGEPRLRQLLEELDQVEGLDWIRLMYFYPMYIDRALLETIGQSKRILPYIDMPLQHASNPVLKRMSRRVTRESTIVAYDDAGGLYAARLWWLARWIGFGGAKLLDGGWSKWTAEGRATTREVPTPKAVAVANVLAAGALVWSAVEVLGQLTDPTCALIDARAGERYRGEVEPMDPVAGHIPGALNRFYKANLNADQTFRPAAEIRREFEALIGGRASGRVGHQCGSGITACANIFAMEYAGLAGSKLYAGSWSEWVADPSRPVAKGAG
jgi:thiosulfate/3-mercaptopyruvate sulfurtransferase